MCDILKFTFVVYNCVFRISDTQTALARNHGITGYLCPRLDHNPWCPTAPGQHGYIFVGLGYEKYTFVEPELFPIFVGLAKQKGDTQRNHRYLGMYKAIRVSPLTAEEWNGLSEEVSVFGCPQMLY